MRRSAPNNRTLSCTDEEIVQLSRDIMRVESAATLEDLDGQVIQGDIFDIAEYLPSGFVDLLILDPPYNISKDFNGNLFRKKDDDEYSSWFEKLIDLMAPLLKPEATIYVCSDWRTSTIVLPVLESRFHVRNRITWEREKGRGAQMNWKNNTEDIWFCTRSDKYYFDVEAVKLKRRVLAPYRVNGEPKDWKQEENEKYRLTHASNIWTDITVPFWSMRENTDHPTQKPEKLLAKLVLASSKEGDFVFDPFLGSGTTAVVAEKLLRRWSGVDVNTEFLCLALKRVRAARSDKTIQGYSDGVFWERNSLPDHRSKTGADGRQAVLFP